MSSREPVPIHPRKTFSKKDRARIFMQHDGICGISGVKIGPNDDWQIEHRIPLAMGGTNEDENLYPALVEPHKSKTKQDVKAIAKVKRIEARLNGTRRARKPIPSQGFQKPTGRYQWPKRPFPKKER